MAVAHEEVQAAVQIVIPEEDAEFEPKAAGTSEADGEGGIDKARPLAVRHGEEGDRLVGEVGNDCAAASGKVFAPVDAHRPASTGFGVGGAGLLSLFHVAAASLAIGDIVEEEVPHGVVGHQQIRPAVLVRVAHDYAQGLGHRTPSGCRIGTLALVHRHTGCLADIFKPLPAVIAVQGTLGTFKLLRLQIGASDSR